MTDIDKQESHSNKEQKEELKPETIEELINKKLGIKLDKLEKKTKKLNSFLTESASSSNNIISMFSGVLQRLKEDTEKLAQAKTKEKTRVGGNGTKKPVKPLQKSKSKIAETKPAKKLVSKKTNPLIKKGSSNVVGGKKGGK